MSVASEIAQMQANLNDSYSAIETLGGTLPDNQNFDNLSSSISRLSTLYVGQYVKSSLPITSAGLHLLDGGIIQGNGIYKEFVDYIAGLYGNGTNIPNYFTDETTWQNSVSTYGTCGKFVYDSVNNTVRLPKITGFIEGTTDTTALGDLVEAGCPNITGNISAPGINSVSYSTYIVGTGAFSESGTADTIKATTTSGGKKTSSLSFDASRSSSIYGNSNTVQPQSIKALYYVVIATIAKTDIEVDIDKIASDLNEKVDKADLAPVHCVVETYQNGTSWYRVYDDGWCEQGGVVTLNNGNVAIQLLKHFNNNTYTVLTNPNSNSTSWPISYVQVKYTSYFTIDGTGNCNAAERTITVSWFAYGYIS